MGTTLLLALLATLGFGAYWLTTQRARAQRRTDHHTAADGGTSALAASVGGYGGRDGSGGASGKGESDSGSDGSGSDSAGGSD